jgi:hypothetical protein
MQRIERFLLPLPLKRVMLLEPEQKVNRKLEAQCRYTECRYTDRRYTDRRYTDRRYTDRRYTDRRYTDRIY